MVREFVYGPAIRIGAGAALALADMVPARRILIVTDVGVRSAGLLDAPLAALAAAGRDVAIFDAVEPDPTTGMVAAALAAAHAHRADAVIGFGGGSPMDVAKLVAYLAGSGDELEAIFGVGQARGQRLPLACVPTTAGTGSEATPVAIVTVGGAEKRGVSSRSLLPDWAVLDAALTTGLPRAVTAATGIDAMVHAIEAYTSARLKNPMSDLLAREALRLIGASLSVVCDDPADLPAREAMLLGAHIAGVAFANAPVGGVHALAYPLGGHFHIPHGLSNALVLVPVLQFNMPAARHLYAELGVVLDPGLAGADMATQAEGLLATMRGLIARSGLPTDLTSVGIARSHLDLLAGEAMKQGRLLANNPRPIDQADARGMYEAAL